MRAREIGKDIVRAHQSAVKTAVVQEDRDSAFAVPENSARMNELALRGAVVGPSNTTANAATTCEVSGFFSNLSPY